MFPIGGARTFQALWHFTEGLYSFYELFSRKEGFLKPYVVFMI